MSEATVSAVIVTYNRLELLKVSIQKVLGQNTPALKHVIMSMVLAQMARENI